MTERETGNPRTAGAPLRHAGADRGAVRAAGRACACGAPLARAARTARRSCSPPAASPASRAAAARARHAGGRRAAAARGAVEHRRRAAARARRPARARAPGWTSSTAATMPAPPARSSERDFVPLAQLYARHATVTRRATASATRRARGRRSTSCSGSRAGPARAPGYVVAAGRARRARSRDRTVAEHGRARRGGRRAGCAATGDGRRSRSRRRSRRRSAGCGRRGRRARRRRRLGGGRRRRRDRHGRLRERAGRRARARADRRGRGARRCGAPDGARLRQRASRSRVGIEEELLLVDPATGSSRPSPSRRAARALDAARGRRGARGRSPPRSSCARRRARPPPRPRRALRRGRAAARAAGATLMAAGLHPRRAAATRRSSTCRATRASAATMRGLMRRTPECALHVHVGMPDPETAIRVFNGLRPTCRCCRRSRPTPRSGSGVDSGLASARCALVRSYPGRGVPRAFRDFDDYEHVARDRAARRRAGGPHAALVGRAPAPAARDGRGARDGRAVAARATSRRSPRSCTASRATRPSARRRPSSPREALSWSSFRAARDGIDASSSTRTARVRPLREVARTLLSRLVMVAGELDEGDALEEVERLLARAAAPSASAPSTRAAGWTGSCARSPSARGA